MNKARGKKGIVRAMIAGIAVFVFLFAGGFVFLREQTPGMQAYALQTDYCEYSCDTVGCSHSDSGEYTLQDIREKVEAQSVLKN
jgi:hypothetical protein